MLKIRANKFLLGFLLLAIAGFLFLSLGGEYLHAQIHQHPSRQSSDVCPFHHLLLQALLVLMGLLFLSRRKKEIFGGPDYFILLGQTFASAVRLRAPPSLA